MTLVGGGELPMSYGSVPTTTSDHDHARNAPVTAENASPKKWVAFGLLACAVLLGSLSVTQSWRSAPADSYTADLAATDDDDGGSGESPDRVETCLQGKCTRQMADLGKDWSHPSTRVIMKCLEDADADQDAAKACIDTTPKPWTEPIRQLRFCAICKECMPGHVPEKICDGLPKGWGAGPSPSGTGYGAPPSTPSSTGGGSSWCFLPWRCPGGSKSSGGGPTMAPTPAPTLAPTPLPTPAPSPAATLEPTAAKEEQATEAPTASPIMAP